MGRQAGLAAVAALACLCAAMASYGAAPPRLEDLAACAAIAAANARLACYDDLASRAGVSASRGTTAPPPAPAATASPAAPTAPSTAVNTTENFGFSPAKIYKDQGPASIEAHIASISADGMGHAQVALDIGQTWTVVDASNALSVGDAVKIKRASLGSYLMAVGSKGAFRVHRVQ